MSARQKTIMLVDDDTDFVDMNKAVLEAQGYEVAVAYNGIECLDKVRSSQPDLIVLDAAMSTLSDGFRVARELRNSESTSAIPLLMVTSINKRFGSDVGPDDKWLPVDAFIDKPVEPQRLLDEIEKLLEA